MQAIPTEQQCIYGLSDVTKLMPMKLQVVPTCSSEQKAFRTCRKLGIQQRFIANCREYEPHVTAKRDDSCNNKQTPSYLYQLPQLTTSIPMQVQLASSCCCSKHKVTRKMRNLRQIYPYQTKSSISSISSMQSVKKKNEYLSSSYIVSIFSFVFGIFSFVQTMHRMESFILTVSYRI